MLKPSDGKRDCLKPHLWLIKFIGVLVPRRLRADWRQEWEAELSHREAMLAEWDRLDWPNKINLLRRSLGAFWDALLLQPRRLEDEMFQDLRFGLRMMLKQPGFTAMAALTLALGIGANTAIFSLVDAVLLKTLPVRNPKELVFFAHSGRTGDRDDRLGSNYPLYEHLRDHNQSFAGMSSFWPMSFKVRQESGVEIVPGQYATGSYFSTLGVSALLGRTISAADDADAMVAVISHRFWEGKFAKDPAVIGKQMVVNGNSLTIIGVTPPDFLGLLPGEPTEISIPLAAQPKVSAEFGDRREMREGLWGLTILGRLKPGAQAEQARADLDALMRQWMTENKFPEQMVKDSFTRAELMPAGQGLDGLRFRFSKPLKALMGAVGLLLLIACANIASMLLARSAARQKEMAVRLAMGASRRRLIRQLLTEGVLLAALGGVAGVLFGWWGSDLLVAFISSGPVQVKLDVSPDLRALGFTAAVSLLAGIAVSLAPALQSARIDLTPALKESVATVGFGRRWQSGRALIALQVALSLVLVIGATMFAFSLRNIIGLGAGFQTENLLLVGFDPLGTGYDRNRLNVFYSEALERVRSLPGVRAVSLSTNMPLSGDDSTRPLSVPGYVPIIPEDLKVHVNWVSTAFFETMRIPLLKGREFMTSDGDGAAKVAVINETLARFYFGDNDPVGKVVWIGREPNGPPIQIVGVARDSKQKNLRQAPPRMIYLPFLQDRQPYMTLEARTAMNPDTLIPAVRQALLEVNRDIPINEIKTGQAQLEGGLVAERLIATLSNFFGALALLLAAIGLYGTLSHFVARKTREIGVRMALGARARDVLRLVMREAAWPLLIGISAGLLTAMALQRVVTGQFSDLLFGVTATNPVVLSLSIAALLVTAALSAYLPARKATKVDPMVALRQE
jgi:putative ABC transport system permease protein